MKIASFIEEYDLHDSLLENISISVDIDFCNWRQKNYSPEEDEMKVIKVTFENVQSYHLDSNNDTLDSDSILEISWTRR